MRSIVKGLSALLMVTGVGLAAAAPAQEEPIRLRIGYDGFSMTTTPMQYALEAGLFEKHGLDVELLYVEGGSVLTQALVGRSVDIAQNGYAPAVGAAVAGADLVIFGGIANILPMLLVVDSSVQSADDLRGKAVAISRYGSATDVAVRMAVESIGLTAEDINILQLGNEGTRAAAFLSGQVQGTMSQYPGAQNLIDQGAHVLVDVAEVATDYPNTSYVTTRSYLDDNHEAIRRFYMVMAEGLRAYRDDPEGAARVSAEFLQLELTPNVETAVQYYADTVFQLDLQPSLTGVQAVLDELESTNPNAANFSPEDLVDTTVLDELVAEGFFTSLDQ